MGGFKELMQEQIEKMALRLNTALNEKDIPLVSSILTQMWLMYQIYFTQITAPELKELTYLKTPIDIGNGKYLLTFMHVDGEKIQLHQSEENV
jgi:hypothetical protein